MRRKTKNILVSGTAVGLAYTLAVGALLQSSVSVAASAAMMPGIEEIVKNTNKEAPLRILEIVDDKSAAEIGYYISGQEPFLKLYQYHTVGEDGNLVSRNFHSVEEGLSVLKTMEERKAFVENSPLGEDGSKIKDIRGLCGDEIEDYPLSYRDYEERYFLTGGEETDDSWKYVAFENEEIRVVELPGHYEKVNPGEGDYKKEEIFYYPVRSDVPKDGEKAKYRENIFGFAYVGEGNKFSPYQVNFIPVLDGNGNPVTSFDKNQVVSDYDYKNGNYGYYENVYRELTADTNPADFPGEKEPVEKVFLSAEEVNPMDAFSAPEEFGDGTFSEPMGDFEDPFSDFGVDEFSSEPAAAPILVGTDDDPMIYRAQLIREFPNYKYMEYATLSSVSNLAKTYSEDGTAPEITDGTITLEPDGSYKLWTVDELGILSSEYLYYVQGRSYVSMGSIRNLPQDYYTAFDVAGNPLPVHPYYYRASQNEFACSFFSKEGVTIGDAEKYPEAYQFSGWYYAFKPENEEIYVQTEENPTYYTSDAEYTLVPGKGDYKFVYAPGEELVEVPVNHLYYRGGYTNHDWFKRYVVHLSPEDEDPEVQQQFLNFDIQVDTLTAAEFEEKYGGAVAADSMDAVVFSDSIADEAAALGDVFRSEEESVQPEFTEGETAEFTAAEFSENEMEPEEEVLEEVEPMISEASESLVSFEVFVEDDEETDAEFEAFEEDEIEVDTSVDDNVIFEDDESAFEEAELVEEFEDSLFGDGESIEFSDADNLDAASLAVKTELPLPENIQDYDLIYVNGALNESTAKGLAELRVPCILNQSVLGNDGNRNGFGAFLHAGDGDSHYVEQYIYVFRNTFGADDSSQISLMNGSFHIPFYQESADGFIDETDFTVLEGFEEILDYIHGENQYRELANEGMGDDTGYGPLSTEISQARAVEYILNFRHKRVQTMKEEIHVLEIQPANAAGTLKAMDVMQWIYGKYAGLIRPSSCCEESASPISNILDGNKNTFWHNDWRVGADDRHKEPWFLAEIIGNSSEILGVYYTPRQDSRNGRANKYRVEVLDENKNPINEVTVEGAFGNTSYEETQEILFQENLPDNAKYIKFIFSEPMQDGGGVLATCAEFGVIGKIHIDTMTSSEFVGHIDDLNTKYDLIYFGDDSNDAYYSALRNGGRNADGAKRLYSHTGAKISKNFYTAYMGLLDIDYAPGTNRTQFLNPASDEIPDNVKGKIGVMRGSGNDITAQQVRELNSFAASGYPIVVADGLLKGGQVNTEVVDSSSYMYQFLNNTLSRTNVFAENELEDGGELSFFANLAKPQIVFADSSCLPPEPRRLNDASYRFNKEAEIRNLGDSEDGLRFEFSIKNDSEISTVNASYNCELFLDLNFDGNLAGDENQSAYIQIQEKETGKVLGTENERYQLEIGKTYILTRKIPIDYFKIITWKLEISNNDNLNIRTSKLGFTKRTSQEKQDIKVLQIVPDGGGHWNLEYTPGTGNDYGADTFQGMISQIDDFDVTVKTETISSYVKRYSDNIRGNNAVQTSINILDEYQMLIIGFDDAFANIPNVPKDSSYLLDYDANFKGEGAVEAILQFVNDGKSVLFTHDTTSFINRDTSRVSNNLVPDGMIADTWLWGYSLNTYLRSAVGMDRYGIVSPEKLNDFTDSEEGFTISDILRQGHALSAQDEGLWNAVRTKVGDMAYEYNDPATTSLMTQGYTNNIITRQENYITSKASKVNEGAITQYPYYIGEKITTAQTHSQYYQLAMEEDTDRNGKNDIVVWYCLAPGDEEFGKSPNDVRNHYYFYSKGNVIYTGVGHSEVEGFSGNEQEKQLFINAIVAAAAVTAVDPEVRFLQEFDPVSETESCRYYSTDQSFWNPESRNVLERSMEFYLGVKNYNMVAAGLMNEETNSDMRLELFVEDPDSDYEININGTNTKVSRLSGNHGVETARRYSDGVHIIADENGVFHIRKSDAFAFSVDDIESYVRTGTQNYNNDCRIYAKVTSTITLYGHPTTRVSWAVLDLRRRQLFEMD